MRPEDLPDLPAAPGCYIFRAADGQALYVGKARSLRSRVRSYFQSPDRLTPKTAAMVRRAHRLEVITTGNEVEALLLENTLIKRHRPRYNILLRDDKTYPYLKITPEPFPRLLLVRRVEDDGGRYFGPYASAGAVRDTLRLLRRVFPMRTCTPHKFAQARRPCLEYHIRRCPAPCVGRIDREAYAERVEGVRQFLEGRVDEVRRRLAEQMHAAAEAMAFERAAELRDLLRAVERLSERQEVVRLKAADEDYLGVAREGRTAAVSVLQVRGGKLVGRETYFLHADPDADTAAVLQAFLGQYYPIASSWPREVCVPTDAFEEGEAVAGLLAARGARLRVPRRGDRARLMAMAADNARWAVREEHLREERRGAPLEELRDFLGLDAPPSRIEGYDISNLQGTDSVASMVVFLDGRPAKREYRQFRIRTVEGADDFASHAETMERRLRHHEAERQAVAAGALEPERARFLALPDLVLIDGGRGQLSAVRAVMRRLGYGHIPAFALAKEEELLYREGEAEPIRLPRDSPALHLLQAVRDESHRFALRHHRRLRSHRTLTSRLAEVPGVGEARTRRLLRHFGSADAVAQASEEALRAAGLPGAVAARLYAALRTPAPPQAAERVAPPAGAYGGRRPRRANSSPGRQDARRPSAARGRGTR
ncbi:MAG: excinuclease ABC subunit UvrC [Firmicutes bacterium]|nr:excinuclease ABC subunit UvrC [Bacillota bacterium]